jgi:peptidoglycan-associated lipoprotein
MKKIIVLSLVLISFSFAIFEDLESGARAEGMANAFTALSNDPSAIQYNPAGLVNVSNISAMVFYKLLYGGVGANLHNICVNAAYPINDKAGVVGLGLQEMGISLHSEKVLTLSHSFNLIRDIAFGYNIRGYQLSQADYGSTIAFGVDFGILSKIYQRWQYGFYVRNINSPKMGNDVKYNLPRIINVGIAYRPTVGINSTFDISKEVGKPTRIAVGQELQIIEDYLTLRAGIQTEPIRFGFGLRTGMKNVFIDYALTTHSELPLTHNFGILINLGTKKERVVKKEVTITLLPELKPETTEIKPIVEPKLSSIYFDLDKSDIRQADAEILKANSQVLKENSELKVTIEGNCCPLGTAEYNIALGWRRAQTTKEYLVRLGVLENRLNLMSFGEENLITEDEAEYWQNRRCDIVEQ